MTYVALLAAVLASAVALGAWLAVVYTVFRFCIGAGS